MKLLQHDPMAPRRPTVRSRWDEQITLAASVSHTSKTVLLFLQEQGEGGREKWYLSWSPVCLMMYSRGDWNERRRRETKPWSMVVGWCKHGPFLAAHTSWHCRFALTESPSPALLVLCAMSLLPRAVGGTRRNCACVTEIFSSSRDVFGKITLFRMQMVEDTASVFTNERKTRVFRASTPDQRCDTTV
jgi:hypothetical protein